MSFSTAFTPATPCAISAALFASLHEDAVPLSVTTPLTVLTLILRALTSLLATISDFTLVVIQESSTYAPVFSPVLAQPARPSSRAPRTSQLVLNAFFIISSGGVDSLKSKCCFVQHRPYWSRLPSGGAHRRGSHAKWRSVTRQTSRPSAGWHPAK